MARHTAKSHKIRKVEILVIQNQISNIGFQIKKHVYINTHTIHESQIILGQGEVTSQYYDINDFKKAIYDMQLDGSTKIMHM